MVKKGLREKQEEEQFEEKNEQKLEILSGEGRHGQQSKLSKRNRGRKAFFKKVYIPSRVFTVNNPREGNDN